MNGETLKGALEEASAVDTGQVSAPLDWTAERHAGLDGARLYEYKGGRWTQLTGDFVSPAQ